MYFTSARRSSRANRRRASCSSSSARAAPPSAVTGTPSRELDARVAVAEVVRVEVRRCQPPCRRLRHHVLCARRREKPWNTRPLCVRSSGGQVSCTLDHQPRRHGRPSGLAVAGLAAGDAEAGSRPRPRARHSSCASSPTAHSRLLEHAQRQTPACRDVLDDRGHLLGPRAARRSPCSMAGQADSVHRGRGSARQPAKSSIRPQRRDVWRLRTRGLKVERSPPPTPARAGDR